MESPPVAMLRQRQTMCGRMLENLCGRPLSTADVEAILRGIQLANPPIRAEIAQRVCRALDWTNVLGQPKLMSCRVGLLGQISVSFLYLPRVTNPAW